MQEDKITRERYQPSPWTTPPAQFQLACCHNTLWFCYVAQARIINYHRSLFIDLSIINCLRIWILDVVFHILSIDEAMYTPS